MHLNMKYALAVLCIGFLGGCGGKDNTTSGSGKLEGSITIDGSSTVYPITEAVAEEFRAEQSKIRITVGISGTGGGFKKFSRGEIDINDASRQIKEQEIAACKENGIRYLELKVAFDGLAVLANTKNTWLNNITVDELKLIWSPEAQGKITKWSQIRPEWPAEEFHLYGPGVASGTYDYFTEVIVGKIGSSRGDFTASEDDNVLVQGIAGDKNALGFFGLAYYEENKSKLKLIGVDNGTAVVLPSEETIKDGTYAPLSRPIFIYVTDQAAHRKEVISFIEFYLRNSSVLVPDVGYIPLPDDEYARQAQKFAEFHSQK